MKKFCFVLMLCIFIISACGSSTTSDTSDFTETGATDTSVSNAVSGGIDVLSDSLSGSSSGIDVALLTDKGHESRFANIFSLIPNAYGALGTGGCSLSDPDVTVTIDCNDTTHISSMLIDYGQGCDVGSNVVVTGKKKILWENMGQNSCGVKPHFWRAVQGVGSKRTVSTDPDSMTSPLTSIVRTLNSGVTLKVVGHFISSFSDYSNQNNVQSVSSTVQIPGTSRIRYRADGTTKIFDHTVYTDAGSELIITTQKDGTNDPTRTLQTGVLKVAHNLAKFTVANTFNNVHWDYNICECQPISGSINISVVDDATNAVLGSGKLDFTYEQTKICGSANLTYDGKAVSFPTLDNCR